MTPEDVDQVDQQPAGAFTPDELVDLIPLVLLLAALASIHAERMRRARRRRTARQLAALAGLMQLLQSPERLESALLSAGIQPPTCPVCSKYPSQHPGLVACQPPS